MKEEPSLGLEKEPGCLKQILYAILGLILATVIGITVGYPAAWVLDKLFPPSSHPSSLPQKDCDLFGCFDQ